MIYACKDCGFLFSRVSEVWECPSCEGKKIRPATKEEAQRVKLLLEEENSDSHMRERQTTKS